MLLHAGERHLEFVGELRNRSVCTTELLQNATSGGVRERGERGIEMGLRILNHMVQFITHRLAMQGRAALPPPTLSRARRSRGHGAGTDGPVGRS